MIRLLMDYGIDLSNFGNGGIDRMFSNACGYCDIDTIKFLIESGIKIDCKNSNALNTAIRQNRYEISKFLIENGFDVNAKDGTALMSACNYGYVDLVRLLLENGANVQSNGAFVHKCTMNAHKLEHENTIEILKTLLDYGADVHAQNDLALLTATIYGNSRVVQFLLDNGANIDAFCHPNIKVNKKENYYSTIDILIDHGVDPHALGNFLSNHVKSNPYLN